MISTKADKIIVENWDKGNKLEQITFADGNRITTSEIDDILAKLTQNIAGFNTNNSVTTNNLLANKEEKIQELEREMEAPDFWDDPEKSQSKMKELKSMKDDVATYAKLKEQYEDIETMIEMGYE